MANYINKSHKHNDRSVTTVNSQGYKIIMQHYTTTQKLCLKLVSEGGCRDIVACKHEYKHIYTNFISTQTPVLHMPNHKWRFHLYLDTSKSTETNTASTQTVTKWDSTLLAANGTHIHIHLTAPSVHTINVNVCILVHIKSGAEIT